jgi:hypothetical protein
MNKGSAKLKKSQIHHLVSVEEAPKNKRLTALFAVLVVIALLLIQGCATPSRLPAVPNASRFKAEVPSLPGVRFWDDTASVDLKKEGLEALRKEKSYLTSMGYPGPLPPVRYLALSGGGDKGAFGAGLLVGWTAAGNRPQFKVVTGISTGALIAPFAFLGPEYDGVLKNVYTQVSMKDILKRRNLVTVLFKDAMADTTPLWSLIERYVDKELLKAIAAEYQKGRLLLIGTTNLDAQSGVIWNMGKIAASRSPEALKLFQSIMIASASIPGAFPPVLVDVQVNGKKYQEMHVDGGAVNQVFIYPPSFKLGEVSHDEGIVRERELYIIRNARLDPDWADVERRTLPIASRAISSLIQSQGIGDLHRIYMSSQRDGIEYNLAFIPPTFKVPHKEEFDTNYMRQLFDLAYGLAVNGYPWHKHPPGFDAASAQDASSGTKEG